jgi:hypothetical protein
MNPLRVFDDRVLARLGRGLRRIGRGLRRSGGAVVARGRRTTPRGALLGVFVVVAVIAVGAAQLRERPDDADPTTGDVVRVGVTDGEQVAGYLSRSRAEISALPARDTGRYALVTLESYLDPAALAPLLVGARTERVYARVPLPGVQTEIVSFPVQTLAVDVPASMRRTADRKDADARESDASALAASGDGARERELRAFYRRGAGIERAEAAAYRRLCACVYAAVVTATPQAVREIAKRPGVRVVDPAPEVKRLDRAVFLPLLPEQRTVVTPPSDAGLPSAGVR